MIRKRMVESYIFLKRHNLTMALGVVARQMTDDECESLGKEYLNNPGLFKQNIKCNNKPETS